MPLESSVSREYAVRPQQRQQLGVFAVHLLAPLESQQRSGPRLLGHRLPAVLGRIELDLEVGDDLLLVGELLFEHFDVDSLALPRVLRALSVLRLPQDAFVVGAPLVLEVLEASFGEDGVVPLFEDDVRSQVQLDEALDVGFLPLGVARVFAEGRGDARADWTLGLAGLFGDDFFVQITFGLLFVIGWFALSLHRYDLKSIPMMSNILDLQTVIIS